MINGKGEFGWVMTKGVLRLIAGIIVCTLIGMVFDFFGLHPTYTNYYLLSACIFGASIILITILSIICVVLTTLLFVGFIQWLGEM